MIGILKAVTLSIAFLTFSLWFISITYLCWQGIKSPYDPEDSGPK